MTLRPANRTGRNAVPTRQSRKHCRIYMSHQPYNIKRLWILRTQRIHVLNSDYNIAHFPFSHQTQTSLFPNETRNCTYNVTMRRVHETLLLQRKSNKYYILCMCVYVGGWMGVGKGPERGLRACSLAYSACKAHAPYYIAMWPVELYHIFPLNLINGTVFFEKKKFLNINVCLDFLYNFYLKHFSFWPELGEILSQMYICLHVKHPLPLPDLNNSYYLELF